MALKTLIPSFIPHPTPPNYCYYNVRTDLERQDLMLQCKQRLDELQRISPLNREDYLSALQHLLGSLGEESWIVPPFFCDYGTKISIGEGSFVNSNCTILDGGSVTIGDHVLIGPSVNIYSVGHPLDLKERADGWEFGHSISISDHVWIGGHSVLLPGVSIGLGSVIGAGSVVTRSIPPMSLAVGNPCRVIRSLRETDAETL
jgi:Acetyltransferase (isoleucine patch superfamily)